MNAGDRSRSDLVVRLSDLILSQRQRLQSLVDCLYAAEHLGQGLLRVRRFHVRKVLQRQPLGLQVVR